MSVETTEPTTTQPKPQKKAQTTPKPVPQIPWVNLTEDGGVKKYIMVEGEGEVLKPGDPASSEFFAYMFLIT